MVAGVEQEDVCRRGIAEIAKRWIRFAWLIQTIYSSAMGDDYDDDGRSSFSGGGGM